MKIVGFCFDVNCYDDVITDFNVKFKSKELIDLVKAQAANYATSNTILTMGKLFLNYKNYHIN